MVDGREAAEVDRCDPGWLVDGRGAPGKNDRVNSDCVCLLGLRGVTDDFRATVWEFVGSWIRQPGATRSFEQSHIPAVAWRRGAVIRKHQFAILLDVYVKLRRQYLGVITYRIRCGSVQHIGLGICHPWMISPHPPHSPLAPCSPS